MLEERLGVKRRPAPWGTRRVSRMMGFEAFHRARKMQVRVVYTHHVFVGEFHKIRPQTKTFYPSEMVAAFSREKQDLAVKGFPFVDVIPKPGAGWTHERKCISAGFVAVGNCGYAG